MSIRPGVLVTALAFAACPTIGSAQNLITNPSFEAPVIGVPTGGCIQHGSWMTCDSAAVPGWAFKWVDNATPGRLELQNNTVVTATDGNQYAELASDDRGGDARVEISQTVELSLCPLDEYTLTYDHRQRQSDDVLTVAVNGGAVAPVGNPHSTAAWNSYAVAIAPLASSITVSFAETGGTGTLGSFLDNVSLTNDFPDSACPALDAKPMSYPNGANLCQGNGVVPVAFVGNQYFNPNDWTIVGVSLSTNPGDGDFVVGKGKSEACHVEDVVDGTNPDGYAPDSYDDVVCHIPAMDLSNVVDTSGAAPAVATVCLTINDGYGGDNITICASDELKLSRTCE